MGYFFLIPSFFFLAVFLIYPMIKSMVMSFTDWNGFNPDYQWVGLKNYVNLFTDTPAYWSSIKINLIFAVVSTAIQTALGFLLAFAVYHMTAGWQKFYKVSLYIPVILPASVIAVMWRFMLSPDTGLVNNILRLIGLDFLCHAWVGENATALGTVIAVNTWQYVGFTMVLYYIAMQNIPLDILESAEIDGAGRWQRIRYITLPGIRPTIMILLLMNVGNVLNAGFEIQYLLGNGLVQSVAQTIDIYVLKWGISQNDFAIGTAAGIFKSFVSIVLVVIANEIAKRTGDERLF